MSTEPSEVRVDVTPEFRRNVRALARKYPHLRADLQPVIERLQRGETVGDRVQGTRYVVFKARVRNSDLQKGKSSGYRLIYQIEAPTHLVLVTLYSKLDQGDISPMEIRRVLAEFDEE